MFQSFQGTVARRRLLLVRECDIASDRIPARFLGAERPVVVGSTGCQKKNPDQSYTPHPSKILSQNHMMVS
jgi:hypothetical protein